MPADSGYNAYPELADLYDAVPMYTSRRDLQFWVDLCREAGDALELGCGTGRVLIPAAQTGCTITGVDQSPHMLARCRSKIREEIRDRITLVEGDITDFHLGRKFKLAIVPFRPFQHLITVAEQMGLLASVREHLEPGGRLVFDVFNP